MNERFMEDNEIITRCLGGDSEAFEHLVLRYQNSVLALCWSILRNREEARDAAQDSFVRAFRNLQSCDQNRSFKNWLYSIATHQCLDRIRKQKSLAKYLGKNRSETWREDPVPEYSDSSGIPERMGNLLDRLKHKERAVLLLKARDGYSAGEIAEIFRCSPSTARVYLHNARRKLKRWMKER